MNIKNVFLYCLLSMLTCGVLAQQKEVKFTGKVTAYDDGQAIAQASVSIDKKGIGTSTNGAGMFALLVPAANFNDSLKISCIGFKTKSFAVNTLKANEPLSIVLEKNSTSLNEVTITYYDPVKIIHKAIDRIPENYINHPHLLRGFYRMYTYSDNAPLQLSEAVFDLYNFGYGDKHADQFKLVKARSEKNERDFSNIELGQKPNSVFEADVVNHLAACKFLNDEGLNNHEFTAHGIVDVKGYRAYQIDFKEKKGVDDVTFRGRMYIDTKTDAFIYFDFGLSPSSLNELGYSGFAAKALMKADNVQLAIKKDHSVVSYQQVADKWVLSGVEGTNTLSVQSTDGKSNLTAHVKFNYQVTAVDTEPKSSLSSKLGRNENINDHDSNNDPSFWKDYNILLSDDNAGQIFDQIKSINSTISIKNK